MNPTHTEPKSLDADEMRRIDTYWRAANYLSAGMIYLRANPLLREPLRADQIKRRLLGHWGTDPGQSFIWVHLNRVINKFDLNMMYIAGPGHGAPATRIRTHRKGWLSSHQLTPPQTTIFVPQQSHLVAK